MVVVGILAVLIATLVAVGGSVLTNAKIRDTRAVMLNLQTAIEQFNDEAPLKRVQCYRGRYGDYPCDELEGFEYGTGIPGCGQVIAPGGGNDPNKNVLNIPGGNLDNDNPKNQDVKAMAFVVRLYSAEVAAILDRISSRYRRPPDNLEEFFDRNGDGDPNTDDVPLGYFVDTWGTPLAYFATREPAIPGAPTPREDTSIALVQHNRGKPVLVSYGPDGPDQFSPDFAIDGDPQDLVYDFNNDDPTAGVIDNPLNEDNVYVDETLKERLRRATD